MQQGAWIFWGICIIASCKSSPAHVEEKQLSAGQRDSLNKVFFQCNCSDEVKQWMEKPKKATVTAHDVLIRWHPFSPKIVGVADSGDVFEVYAHYKLENSSFGLLLRDTLAYLEEDTLELKKGRRLHWIWHDTMAHEVKTKMRRYDNDAPYFPNRADSLSFYMVLPEHYVELLPDTKWYYIRTKNETDACILERYLRLENF
ncbi:MAG: hypothetical protein SFV22_12835 [Saprospiraceae bacterium]|nr:hypothetical protein [Saprospiraceae bacterium]